MVKTFVISGAAQQAACDSIVDLLDLGTGANPSIKIYNAASATLLASCDMGTGAAFGAASTAGAAAMTTATATGTGLAAAGTGTVAAQFRFCNKSGIEIAHGSVGTGTAFTMDITNTTIASGDTIQVTAATVTVPAS